MKQCFILFLFFTMITSCVVVESTQLEVVKPAGLILPPHLNAIGLLNHNVLKQDLPFETEVQQGLFRLDSLTSIRLVNKVYGEFFKSPRFNHVAIADTLLIRTKEQITKPSSWEIVKSFCDSMHVDALLSLEAMAIRDTIRNYSYSNGYESIMYEVIILNVHSLWRLYIPEPNKQVHKQIFSDTIILDELDNYEHLEYLLKSKQGISWIANRVSNEQYIHVADKFAPYWVSESRIYYKGINTDFRLAGKYAEADQWLKAAEIWKKYTQVKQKYIASAACSNMALVCEVQGKLELSQSWIDKALTYKVSMLNEAYKEIIDTRLKEQNRLNNQFGIIE